MVIRLVVITGRETGIHRVADDLRQIDLSRQRGRCRLCAGVGKINFQQIAAAVVIDPREVLRAVVQIKWRRRLSPRGL